MLNHGVMTWQELFLSAFLLFLRCFRVVDLYYIAQALQFEIPARLCHFHEEI